VHIVGHSHVITYHDARFGELKKMYKSECEIFSNHERENDDLRFGDVTSYRLFGGTCYLHLWGRR
jgi:hypothetical protein